MSRKSDRISARIDAFRGHDLDPHYLGYFDCFNKGLYYEAHDVLEELWLGCRRGPDDAFYKGLIQLAGAFVHLQKQRSGPARALFRLARTNLSTYPRHHHRLDIQRALRLIDCWHDRSVAAEAGGTPLAIDPAPRLDLHSGPSVP